MTTKKRPGRPKGSKTQTLDHVDVRKTCCTKCGSDERGPYVHTQTVLLSGNRAVILRRTTCLGCGQQRIDRETKSKYQNKEVDTDGDST